MVSELASFVPYHALFPMDRGNIEKKIEPFFQSWKSTGMVNF